MIVSWGLSLVGRAPALHAGGQEFDSPSLHQSVDQQSNALPKRKTSSYAARSIWSNMVVKDIFKL